MEQKTARVATKISTRIWQRARDGFAIEGITTTRCSGFGIIRLRLLLNEFAPHIIRTPNGVQVALGFGNGDVFNENAIKIHERGDAHVGGTMNEDCAVIEGIHDSTESIEVLCSRSLETHRNVDVGHAKTSDNATFVWKRVVGTRKSEIDDGIEASFANLLELLLGGLAGGGEFVAERMEVVNAGQGC